MSGDLQFEYFYGIEADQFSFYRVPRLLIKDPHFKDLSSDAKLLYGLLLDRMSLSRKNGWIDEQNRAYIMYTIEQVSEDLGCCKEKAVKVLAELDSAKGIGLIEKVRKGLGHPDIIYVKNFVIKEQPEKQEAEDTDENELEDCFDRIAEVGKTEFKKSEKPNSGSRKNRIQEVGKTELQKSEKQNSGGRKNRILEVGKTDPSYINNNYTDYSYTDINQSINQAENDDGLIDGQDSYEAYEEMVKEQIGFEYLIKPGNWNENALLQNIVDLMVEVFMSDSPRIRIGKDMKPTSLVQHRLRSVNYATIEYIIESFSKIPVKVGNIKGYLLAMIFNAPATMDGYYQNWVESDMRQGPSPEEMRHLMEYGKNNTSEDLGYAT